jgi:hypothetical protein
LREHSYLGETCWDLSRCEQGGAEAYAANRVACASLTAGTAARCVPTLLLQAAPKQRCSCDSGTQSFYNILSYFACQSAKCNGHQVRDLPHEVPTRPIKGFAAPE